jgi:hypothetical protein
MAGNAIPIYAHDAFVHHTDHRGMLVFKHRQYSGCRVAGWQVIAYATGYFADSSPVF